MMNQSDKLKQLVGLDVVDFITALKHGIYYLSEETNKLYHYQVRSVTLAGLDVINDAGLFLASDFIVSYDRYKVDWWIYETDLPKEILEK